MEIESLSPIVTEFEQPNPTVMEIESLSPGVIEVEPPSPTVDQVSNDNQESPDDNQSPPDDSTDFLGLASFL